MDSEYTKIETLAELEHYYPSWRTTTNDVVKMLITNKNFEIVNTLLKEVNGDVDFFYLASEFIDDPNILQWLDTISIQYEDPIEYGILATNCVDDPELCQTMINLAQQRNQSVDYNNLSIEACKIDNIMMLDKFIKSGYDKLNKINEMLEEAIVNNSTQSVQYLLQLITNINYPIDYNDIISKSVYGETNSHIIYEFINHMKTIGCTIDFSQLFDMIHESSRPSSNEIKQLEQWVIEQMKIGFFTFDTNAVSLMATDLNMIDLLQYAISNGANDLSTIGWIAGRNGSLPIIQLIVQLIMQNGQSSTDDLMNIIENAICNKHNEIVQLLIPHIINNGYTLDLTSICERIISNRNIVLLEWVIIHANNYPINMVKLSIRAIKCDDLNILKYLVNKVKEDKMIKGTNYMKFLRRISQLSEIDSLDIGRYLMECINEVISKNGNYP